ncbi:MAG TPA: dihydrofolate reductase family protein [Streptosporangiaceae bacterium]|nr:dihydrofolate reductase family protein [Streptosporangiaceae bacterium]
MRLLLPVPGPETGPGTDVDAGRLAGLYAYPQDAAAGRGAPVSPAAASDPVWLRANFVASVDGAATLRGRSRGLSGPADRMVFALLRSLADVIVVGAATARAERYLPVRPHEVRAGLRAGRTATPPIAVVSRRLDLEPDAPLLSAAPTGARTIVITTGLAPEDRRAALATRADVIVAGDETVDLKAALDALAARGHRRLLTEGGPHLLGEFLKAGLLDELCLTVSPLLAGPGPGRIIASLGLDDDAVPGDGVPLTLGHLLEDEGFLLCRYTRGAAAGR